MSIAKTPVYSQSTQFQHVVSSDKELKDWVVACLESDGGLRTQLILSLIRPLDSMVRFEVGKESGQEAA